MTENKLKAVSISNTMGKSSKQFNNQCLEDDDQEMQNMKEEIKDHVSQMEPNDGDDEDELSDAELLDVVTDSHLIY